MKSALKWSAWSLVTVVMVCSAVGGATIQGYVLDPNWYAPHPKLTSPQVYGAGMYEYGVSGNINYGTVLGFYSNTENYSDNYNLGVYGYFRKPGQTDGTYCLATWDTWWRSAYLFNQSLVGYPSPVILRLHANMWSYAPTWEANYTEYGQTFAASGSCVTMVVLRSAVTISNVRVSIHEGGPTGPQIGPSRTKSLGGGPSDTRYIWNGGEVPTVPGRVYYVKILAPSNNMVLCNNEPIPDYSDAAPDGCAYHNGVPWSETSAHPDIGKSMDLGLTICSDDDGIVTSLHTGKGGGGPSGLRVGQTFVARGTSLLSFAAWVGDSSPTYVATLYNGVGGTQIGAAKKNRCMRWADPEVMFTWAPGECPLTPGGTYYVEFTREDGGTVTSLGHNWNPYPSGSAYANRAISSGWDIGGTVMEEETSGSATRPTVQFSSFPAVAFADRGTRSLTVRWTTDVAADSSIEYSAWTTPYTNTYYDSAAVTSHAVNLVGLLPNTMYHLRVRSAASGRNPGVTRDFVACTVNETPNLLANPSFEEGCTSSYCRVYPGWTCSGMDFAESSGGFFWGLPSYAGAYMLQGAVNGSDCQGYVYQTVDTIPGVEYNFTVALTSWLRENDAWKYDVWNQEGRLDQIRVGVDPWGNHNPAEPSIRWTPSFYSHLHYTTVGVRHLALTNRMTVLVSLKGKGGQWHCYGVDDCRLSEANPYTVCNLDELKRMKTDGTMAELQGLVVTAMPGQVGAYYAELPDRTHGIKIDASVGSAVTNNVITVRGELTTDPQTGERSLINSRILTAVSGPRIRPLFMLASAVGGPACGVVPAVPGSTGVHNTGLLVKIGGAVTYRELANRVIYVNDGSMPGHGLRIDATALPADSLPSVGDKVGVVGVSTRFYSGGIKPMVILRGANDIRSY